MLLNNFSKNKAVWTIFLGISVGCITYFSIQIIQKWSMLPMLVTFGLRQMRIGEIPFPAITICAETKLNHTKYKFKDLYHKRTNLTLEEKKMYGIFSLVCDNKIVQYTEGNLTIDKEDLTTLIDSHSLLTKTCYDIYWDGQRIGGCKEQLNPILTEEGLCYTFNMLPTTDLIKSPFNRFKNLTPINEDGQFDLKKSNIIPIKTGLFGAKSGLAVILGHRQEDQDFLCKVPVTGFKISVHSNDNLPKSGSSYIRVPADEEVLISIKPKIVKTSQKLRAFSPERRNCYFQSERNLKHFKHYSRENCEFECAINATLESCKCAAFYMPRNKSTPICGSGNIKCLREAQKIADINVNNKCGCLNLCNEIKYEIESSQAKFEWVDYFRAFENTNFSKMETLGIKFSKVNIFFADSQFDVIEKIEFFDELDAMLILGALTSMFTGFSLLFFIEIILELFERVKNSLSSDSESDSDDKRNDDTSRTVSPYTIEDRKLEIL